jgi:hypothetical protein
MRAAVACLVASLLLAACATPPPGAAPPGRAADDRPVPPSLGLFSSIRAPDGQEVALQLAARGVQIFRCERIGNGFEWRFRQPDAELIDGQGRPAGKHGANFSFEHRDGSRLLGTVVAHDKATSADTLPWLLLSVKSFGKGEFGGIDYVQRVNTQGGMPPATCSADEHNRLLRVPFSADFVFYRPRTPSKPG